MPVRPNLFTALVLILLGSLWLFPYLTTAQQNMDALQRPLPQWYQDAKLGIFIHWGIYSVPAFAQGQMTLEEVIQTLDFASWFADTPYAAWYQNSLKLDGSPTQKHHRQVYGDNFPYEGFSTIFNEGLKDWDPHAWAELFKQAGANYVVLTSKHHDGFLLWPADTPNPFRDNYHASRDIVGELTEAVRAQGLHMGLYYSSGLDWTFNPTPIKDIMSFLQAVPQQQAYVDYEDAHWRELIRRYQPEILWADIGSPQAFDAESLLRDYYRIVPEGVVNDRLKTQLGAEGVTSAVHCDFTTAEYTARKDISEQKWESTRGMGRAFAYNQMETEADYLSTDQLVDMLIDVVSKNGNFLLDIGPRADGTIPAAQQERLLGLGRWLVVNGEAIYGSRYWVKAESTTRCGVPVRFTQNHGNLYVSLLERPASNCIELDEFTLSPEGKIELLSAEGNLAWQQQEGVLSIELPANLPESEAYVLRVVGLLSE